MIGKVYVHNFMKGEALDIGLEPQDVLLVSERLSRRTSIHEAREPRLLYHFAGL